MWYCLIGMEGLDDRIVPTIPSPGHTADQMMRRDICLVSV